MPKVRVFAFAGSLRKGSLHKKLIEASKGLAPEGMEINAYDLKDIPPYNMDLEDAMPSAVADFKKRIAESDGVLMAVPEHNFSFSGVMKNAIDWASRPYGESAFDGKPVILQSVSPGRMGGSRAQYHLRQVLGALSMIQMQFPEVFIGPAGDVFDESGALTDERASEQIRKQLAAFKEFIAGRGD
ncbi:MAG: NAD(P)H-dependent oxidoreductase [Armatimonadetes bacterium]|nr:NAD(P)H-dependent oxidoreductase [Armatimonadota bacterium]